MFRHPIEARKPGISILLCAVLAACGGGGGGDDNSGGGGGTTIDPRVAEFAAMTDRLDSLFNTGFTGQPGEMPSSGSASFDGYAGVLLTPPGDTPLALIGDASIDADFGSKTLTGGFTNFVGDQDGEYGAYSGSVALINGEIGVIAPGDGTRPNDVRFDYNGSLIGQGNTVILNGSADGKFKGTPIRGLVASSSPGELERLNGVDVPAIFSVVAEGSP